MYTITVVLTEVVSVTSRRHFLVAMSLQMFLLSRENSERGRYHEIEECSDGPARSKLAYLAFLYKIAPRNVLIRADPGEEIWDQCLSAVVVVGFRERHFVRSIYHAIEGGSDGAARSKLAYLALLYKIAPRSILIPQNTKMI
jgi:hypothetical protein